MENKSNRQSMGSTIDTCGIRLWEVSVRQLFQRQLQDHDSLKHRGAHVCILDRCIPVALMESLRADNYKETIESHSWASIQTRQPLNKVDPDGSGP